MADVLRQITLTASEQRTSRVVDLSKKATGGGRQGTKGLSRTHHQHPTI